MQGFTFGGSTPWTYEQLQRQRSVAEALAGSVGTPKNVGEGLAAVGKALAVRGINKRAEQEQARMQGEFDDLWSSAFGGGGTGAVAQALMGAAPASPAPSSAPQPASPDRMSTSEAPAYGITPGAAGASGGGFQPGAMFGARAEDFMPAEMTGGAGAPAVAGGAGGDTMAAPTYSTQFEWAMGPRRPNRPGQAIQDALGMTAEQVLGPGATVVVTSGMGEHGSPRHRQGHAADVQFRDPQGNIVSLNDPRARDLAMAAAQNGVTGLGGGEEYMGANTFHMDMYPVDQYTPDMGRAWGSWADGLENDFVAAAGQPRTHGSDGVYGDVYAGGGSDAVMGQAGNDTLGGGGQIPISTLAEIIGHPMASPGQRAVAQAMLERQLQMQDPMYQLQLQAAQQALVPDPVRGIEFGGNLVNPETGEVIAQGQPDPGYVMLSPQQAEAMGLPEGAYQMGPDGRISAIGGGGTSVTLNMPPEVGKLSPDYGYVLDPETRQPVIDPATGLPQAAAVPGSPAALEAQQAEEQQGQRAEQTERAGGIVLEDIDRVLGMLDNGGVPITGGMGVLSSWVPGTEASDAYYLLQTIKGNIGFDRLQQMREASPTGGALGNVTEQELATLQAVLGSLEQRQSAEQFRRNLERLREVYTGIIDTAQRTGDGSFVPRIDAPSPATRTVTPDRPVTAPAGGQAAEVSAGDAPPMPSGFASHPEIARLTEQYPEMTAEQIWRSMNPDARARWLQ